MILRLSLYLAYYLINVVLVKDPLAIALTLPMMLVVIYNVTRIRSRYAGVEDMLTLIMYLYFVIQPLQQIDHGHIGTDGPVSPLTFNNYYLFAAAAAMTIFFLVYTIGIEWLKKSRRAPEFFTLSRNWAETLLLIAIVSCAGYILLSGGLGNVLASRYDKTEEASVFAQPMLASQTLATFILAMFVRIRIDRYLAYFAVAVAFLLVSQNPFNTARFFLIATYVPLVLILIRGRLTTFVFYAGTMFGLVVLMPILSVTSRVGSLDAIGESSLSDSSPLNLPFLDVYDMLVECTKYTDVNGYTRGAKLIGDIGFIIPRSFWTSKPTLNSLDIGGELAEDKIAGTKNLSMFFGGDGYRDLGLLGTAATAIVFLLVIHYLVYRRPKIINGMPVMHFILIASLPILVRGPISAVLPLFFMQAVLLAVYSRVFATPALPPLSFDTQDLVPDATDEAALQAGMEPTPAIPHRGLGTAEPGV